MLVLAVVLLAVATILVVVAPRAVTSVRAGARLAAGVIATAALNIVVLATTHDRPTQVLCSVTSGLLIGTLYRWSFTLRRKAEQKRSDGGGRSGPTGGSG